MKSKITAATKAAEAKETMPALPPDPKATAQRIVTALASGLESAAAIYREYVEAGGNAIDLRTHACMPASAWQIVDDVACGRVDPRLFIYPPTIQRALRPMPKSEQSRLIGSGVDVLAADGSVLRVKLPEMTADQARQVFAYEGGVRTQSQQAAWLKTQTDTRNTPKPPAPPVLWEVDAKTRMVHVNAPCSLTVTDLHRMLGMIG